MDGRKGVYHIMSSGWWYRQTDQESIMPDDHTPFPRKNTRDTCLMTQHCSHNRDVIKCRRMPPAASTTIIILLIGIL